MIQLRQSGLGLSASDAIDAVPAMLAKPNFPGKEAILSTVVDIAQGRLAAARIPGRFVSEIRIASRVSDGVSIRVGDILAAEESEGGGAGSAAQKAVNPILNFVRPAVEVDTVFGTMKYAPNGDPHDRAGVWGVAVGAVVVIALAAIGTATTASWVTRKIRGR